jgi:DNA-binding XRE family transcriptional regulator
VDETKRARLEAKGWKVGTVAEFLELTPEEVALTEIRLTLSRYLLEQRKKAGMTQARLAKLIGSSQPRIAKVEAGDGTVSLDLLMRAVLATGATPHDLGQLISEVGLSIAPANASA